MASNGIGRMPNHRNSLISEMLPGDDNTWIAELQHNAKFNNSDSFEWKHITYDTKTAERKTNGTNGAIGQHM